ncbi:hypothetical protein LTR85_001785 [Meristemomyces frigidus]|nr:hypothetical protein LTR85_001785 [Meristemomyces frigidus]
MGGGSIAGQQGTLAVTSVTDSFDNYVEGSVWFYQPDKIAPPIFAALFLASALFHAYQTWLYKSWKMTLLLPWGAALMVAGFAVREAGAYHIGNIKLLIASTVLLLSGPPVFAGANYFTLGRTLYYIPWLSPVHPGRVVTTFMGIDVIIENLISVGAAKFADSTNSPSERRTGVVLVKVGLIMQAVSFTGYVLLLAIWHIRVKRAGLLSKKLRSVVWMLYASSALITTRCIYRVVEFFEGYTGEVYTHEVYFWVFDASVMLVDSVLLNVFHPGKYFPQKSKIYLAKDGETELKGPGWRDPRKWYWQVIDPFDVAGLFMKGRNDFWNYPPVQDAEAAAGTGGEKTEAGVTASAIASAKDREPSWLGPLGKMIWRKVKGPRAAAA